MKKNVVSSLNYKDCGVDLDKAQQFVNSIKPYIAKTYRSGVVGHFGLPSGVFDLKALNYLDPLLVSTTDGVGTKLKLATNEKDYQNLGQDLVAMCVNDLLVHGAEPLFFLNYLALSGPPDKKSLAIIQGIAKACQITKCALLGGETAQMPGLYQKGDCDLAGFALGIVERTDALPSTTLSQGDIILGIASNGLHANGFSLVRKILKQKRHSLKERTILGDQRSLAELLLKPTKLYPSILLPILKKTKAIKALAHITGGGLAGNITRILPETLCATIDLSKIKLPSIFSWIAQEGQISQKEMLKVFNCGIGMVAIVESESLKTIITDLKAMGEDALLLGKLEKRQNKAVIFQGMLQS